MIDLNKMEMPVANKKAAEQVDRASKIGLQQQFKQLGAAAPVTSGDIQQQGAAVTGQTVAAANAANQADVQRDITTAQRDFQSGQMDQAEQNILDDTALADQRIALEEQLAGMGRDVREKLLDREIRLDERTGELAFTNERQLADLAVAIARDDNDLDRKLQDMQQASQRRLAAAEYAANTYAQAMDFASKDRRFAEDRAMMEEIRRRKQQADDELRKAKQKAATTRKIIGATKIAAAAAITYASGGSAAAPAAGMAASGASDLAGV